MTAEINYVIFAGAAPSFTVMKSVSTDGHPPADDGSDISKADWLTGCATLLHLGPVCWPNRERKMKTNSVEF